VLIFALDPLPETARRPMSRSNRGGTRQP